MGKGIEMEKKCGNCIYAHPNNVNICNGPLGCWEFSNFILNNKGIDTIVRMLEDGIYETTICDGDADFVSYNMLIELKEKNGPQLVYKNNIFIIHVDKGCDSITVYRVKFE